MNSRVTTVVLLLSGILLSSCSKSAVEEEDPEGEIPTVASVAVTIDPAADRREISPYIYGTNQDVSGTRDLTVRRLGGNRLTGYNWENNFSNAGSDWNHSSDRFMISELGVPSGDATRPGSVLAQFHGRSLSAGTESIITLQMAGYVSRDDAGEVSVAQAAPSSRWVRVEPRNNAPFTTTPDATDEVVYMDELVNFLVSRYGKASSPQGVRWYSLDNEPALWSSTHPRIHPQKTGAAELVVKSIALADAVKTVDPEAGILGPALYGFSAYMSLQDAPDWNAVKGNSSWFIDYYLAEMRKAETSKGRRLLDMLDVHWYPEAKGDHRITEDAATTPADIEARLQAPRSLWDPTYVENSWIGQWFRNYLPILPRLQESIDLHYPGTKLAITEYNYGGGNTISGGLAQADVLGAFGRYGVYLATIWGLRQTDTYQTAAFNLYRNYDGSGGKFGEISVKATSADAAQVSVYAALTDESAGTLHVILINKRKEGALDIQFTIPGKTYTSVEAWVLSGTPAVVRSPNRPRFKDGRVSFAIQPMTAAHLVLK